MGNKSSLMLQDEEIKQLSDETGFLSTEIEKLYSRFAHLDRSNCGTLSKDDFLSIPELAINPLCDRLIKMFFSNPNPDHEHEERINFKQFVYVLATFNTTSGDNYNASHKQTERFNQELASNANQPAIHLVSTETRVRTRNGTTNSNSGLIKDDLKRKLLFVFKVYDNDNDGRISFNDLRSILKMMVGSYIEDVRLDKIATRAFVEVDIDCDGFIDFEEFCRVFNGKDLDDKLRVKFFS